MKRWLFFILTFALTVSMLGGMTMDADAQELFGLNWQTFGGEWTFDETGFSLIGDGPSGWPKIITNTTYQHFTIEADFVGVKEGGFVFRCGDPKIGPDSFDGYFVGYDSAYAYFGIDIGRWKTLNEGGPDATAAAPLKYKERMHWKLTVSGNVYTLYVDNMEKPLIQTFDNTFDRAGGVGIRICAKAGEAAGRVENVVINGIPVDEVTYNDKGTYDLWAERLIAQNPASANQNKIILMGASHMEFWRNCQTDLAPYEILNFGMGGSWVRHISGKTESMLIPYNPKAVVISSGGNDASGGASSTQIISELKDYIDSLTEALPGVPIIYVSNWFSPSVESNVNNKNTRLHINEEMIAYCKVKEDVWYLDCSSIVKASDSEIWLSDRMHMNATGYENVAPLFLAMFDEIFAPKAPQATEPNPTEPITQPAPQSPSLVPYICAGIMAAALLVLAFALIPKKKKA